MDPALVPDFEGRYLENEKRFFKNNFETVFWGPNSIIRNQLVKTLQLTFKFDKNLFNFVCRAVATFVLAKPGTARGYDDQNRDLGLQGPLA